MKHMRKLTVKNNSGLHMRPAAEIVNLLRDSKSQVFFSLKDFNTKLLDVIKSKQRNLGKHREAYA